jgi:hypothetical protein
MKSRLADVWLGPGHRKPHNAKARHLGKQHGMVSNGDSWETVPGSFVDLVLSFGNWLTAGRKLTVRVTRNGDTNATLDLALRAADR